MVDDSTRQLSERKLLWWRKLSKSRYLISAEKEEYVYNSNTVYTIHHK